MVELNIYVGSKVIIRGEWRQPTDPQDIPSSTDPLADPTGLTFRIYLPDGTDTEYVKGTDTELVRDTQGKYHVEYLVAQSGLHRWAWLPTGNAAQPIVGEFFAHAI